MPTFKNNFEIQAYMGNVLQSALTEVKKITWNKLYDYIKQEVYIKKTLKISSFSPNWDGYDQTGEFLDYLETCKNEVAVKINSNTYQATIYFDNHAGNPKYLSGKFFNQRMSLNGDTVYDGREINDWLVEWINDGISSPYYRHGGIHFMEFITDWLTTNYNIELKEALKKRGLVIK